jgi:methyl-accepting chemotaxis protein
MRSIAARMMRSPGASDLDDSGRAQRRRRLSDFPEEYRQITAVDRLRQTIQAIAAAAREIASASAEIFSGATDLSQRTLAMV